MLLCRNRFLHAAMRLASRLINRAPQIRKWYMFKSETCVRRLLQWWMFMSQPVYGTIVNYRIGIRTQMPKWCLVQIVGENSVSKAGQLVGRRIILKFGENIFVGRIMSLHGKKGVVTVRFRRGVPGDAIGARVEVVS
jgi:large subunit ribosomal protein L35Ae